MLVCGRFTVIFAIQSVPIQVGGQIDSEIVNQVCFGFHQFVSTDHISVVDQDGFVFECFICNIRRQRFIHGVWFFNRRFFISAVRFIQCRLDIIDQVQNLLVVGRPGDSDRGSAFRNFINRIRCFFSDIEDMVLRFRFNAFHLFG